MPPLWFKALPWKVIGIAAAVVVAFFYYGSVREDEGRREVQTQWDQEKIRVKAAQDVAEANRRTADLQREIEHENRIKDALAAREPIVKYVNRYVATDPTAGRSDLSDSWVRGHDGSALNIDPAALVSGVIDRPSGRPTNGAVLQTVDANYTQARRWRSDLHFARIELAECRGMSPDWIAKNLPAPQ